MTMRFWRSKPAKNDPVVREVPIRDESIRLGQFLKLSDLIDSGADAKPLLAEGVVFVNGELETRRGRQLAKGDVVSVGDEAVRVG
jgi:ribosome-associated protein